MRRSPVRERHHPACRHGQHQNHAGQKTSGRRLRLMKRNWQAPPRRSAQVIFRINAFKAPTDLEMDKAAVTRGPQ